MYRISRILLILSIALLGYAAILAGLWIFVVLVVLAFSAKKTKALWSHGSAKFAGIEDMPEYLDAKEGVILGRTYSKRPVTCLFNFRLSAKAAIKSLFGYRPIVRLTDAVHTCIIAPTGAGKGVSFVMIHALTCLTSMVILDVKGEIARITIKFRKLLGLVWVIDPYCVVSNRSHCLNIIDLVDKDSPTAIDDIRDMSRALVVRQTNEKEPHWCDMAEKVLTTIIAYVAFFAPPEDRNMQSVAEIISNSQTLNKAIGTLREANLCNGIVTRMCDELSYLVEREYGSVMTTTMRMLDCFNTPSIMTVTQKSSFDPRELTKIRQTVYIIIPPERLKANAGFLRVMLWAFYKGILSNGF